MRNPNGFGTVYRMSGKRRKPWRATVNKVTIGYFETKAEGLKALGKHDPNNFKPKSALTLKEVREMLQGAKIFTKGQKKSYNAAWKYLETLYDVPIKEIRPTDMQLILDQTYEKKSQSTVKPILALLKLTFAYAFEQDIIEKDYTTSLKLPKSDTKEKIPFTNEQIKIIQKSKNEWKESALVLIYMGWRIDEFLSLRIKDVDLEEMLIKGGGKTDAGRFRVVPIHKKIQPIIKKWVENNKEYVLEFKGKRMTANNYRERYFKPLMAELSMDGMTPHNCRHTCATLLAKAGASTKEIQLIMGHAEYSTTAQTYTHLDIEDLKNAMKKI